MSNTTNTCCADTAESCSELKIEADSDSVIGYPHDDKPSMSMLYFYVRQQNASRALAIV